MSDRGFVGSHFVLTGPALRAEITAVKRRVESQSIRGLLSAKETPHIDHLRTVCRNLDVAVEGSA